MYLNRFHAENYRNIVSCDLTFEAGVNLLVGDNAQGKTNVLEAIYAFARGKSFRSSSDAELVRFGQSGFTTEIGFTDRNRQQTLSYSFEGGSRCRTRNGVRLTHLSESLGHFRAVLFYPEHLQIIKGGPAERRELVNVAISQLDGQYIREYTAYQKILDNRNFLLKTAQKGGYTDGTELFAWSERLADYAAKIYIKRKDYIKGLAPVAADYMRDISGNKESLDLSYHADTEADTYEEARKDYFSLFTEHTVRECAAGCTLFGVHRDDMEVEISGVSARTFASQGQQRSCVLALKLAEGEYSRRLTGDCPVFLFDDVLSELDEARRAYVLSDTRDKQLILTACDRNLSHGNRNEIYVEGGRYVSSHR